MLIIKVRTMVKNLFINSPSKSKNIKYLLALFVLVFIALKLFSLTYINFLDNYPYFSPDSYSWISDGYHYIGYNTNYVVRAPLYPLLIAALEYIGMLQALPIVGYISFLILILTLYQLLLKLKTPRLAAVFSISIFFVSWLFDIYATNVLADIYALTFISISLYFFICYLESSRHLLLSFAFAAFSGLFQYAGFIVLVAYAVTLAFKYRKKIFTQKEVYFAFIIFSVIILPWFVYRLIEFGDPFYTKVVQFSLLKFHLDGLMFYLFSTLNFLGIPTFVIALLGVQVFLKRKNYLVKLTLINYFLGFVVFWALLYDWLDVRFLLYFSPVILIFVAEGFKHIFNKIHGFRFFNTLLAALVFLCVLYSSYFSGSTTAFVVFPGVFYQPEMIIDSAARSHMSYLTGDLVSSKVNLRHFKILESLFIKKDTLVSGEKELYKQLELELYTNSNVCIHSSSKLDKYIYTNILSIISKSRVNVCQEDTDYDYIFTDNLNNGINCELGYISRLVNKCIR